MKGILRSRVQPLLYKDRIVLMAAVKGENRNTGSEEARIGAEAIKIAIWRSTFA